MSSSDPAVQLLLETLRIYSPSKGEGPLSDFLVRRMNELGFHDVRQDTAGNAIGEVGTGRVHVLLCGHMDTVPGELKVAREGDRVYGRGAADAKSPMCAMISAASRLERSNLKLTVACVTREEGDSLGIETILDAGGDYDYAIFGEPAGASRVTVGYRGRVESTLSFSTGGGHAASPWAHSSAVDEALGFLQRVKRYEREHTLAENHYRSLSAALTMIRGGEYSNVIPGSCEITLDVRVPVGMTCGEVQREFARMADEQRAERAPLRVELRFGTPTEPYESEVSSVIVRAFQRSIIKNLGTKPALTHKTGTGDMNTLAQRMKIPCATYGPGDSRLAHTGEEYVELGDYLDSIRVLRGVFSEIEALSSRS